METQTSVIQAKPVTLSSENQQQIMNFIKDARQKGKDGRKTWMDDADACAKSYDCLMDPIEDPELDWMSNECLPWAYDAADSWYAHIHSTTIPKNDQTFTIGGRTKEDHPGAECMQGYIEYRFERNQFPTQLGKAEKELSRRNHVAMKVYWREDKTVEYPWVDEPVMGIEQDPMTGELVEVETGTKKVRRPKEVTTFNNVWIDIIPLEQFFVYPVRGDWDKATKIHETYKYYEDLISSTDKHNYFNLDEVSLDDEKEEDGGLELQPKGLLISEAWIPRIVIDGKVYRNFIGTMVNDKTLIRFQPYPPSCPKTPFILMPLRRDGDSFYGYGLNSKGLGILRAANKIFNAYIDEGDLTQHNAHKYWEDGIFNPNNVVRRPGAMIQMAAESVMGGNLAPMIEDLSKRQQAMADLQVLKVEFETVTVPKVVKGMIETGQDHTATEISQAQNNSSGKMHIDAYNINDYILKPVLELTYQAIYDRLQYDDSIREEIQTITQPKDPNTQQPLAELPVIPLPQVDIKIVGYQNVIRKQEQLAGMAQALPLLAQSPGGKYIKYDNLGEDTFRLLDLDKDRLWMNEQERQKVDEQESQAAQQQQDLMVQETTGKLDLQKEKQDQDFQIAQEQMKLDFQLKQEELAIKQVELELKRAELDLKQQQQDHAEQMGAHNAAMAERNANFTETHAKEELQQKSKEKPSK